MASRIPEFVVKNLKYFTEVYDGMLENADIWEDEIEGMAKHFYNVSTDCPYHMRPRIVSGCDIRTCPIRNAV